MAIVGIVLVLAGIAAGIRSGLLESRAAPGRHIELWLAVTDPVRAKGSILWQVTGTLLAAIGIFLCLFEWEFVAYFLVLLPQLASVCVTVRHNRSVARPKPTP